MLVNVTQKSEAVLLVTYFSLFVVKNGGEKIGFRPTLT